MRIFEVISKSIEIDILSIEQDMENTINNGDLTTMAKTPLIKECLSKIVNLQLSQAKWVEYVGNAMTPTEENNNNKE